MNQSARKPTKTKLLVVVMSVAAALCAASGMLLSYLPRRTTFQGPSMLPNIANEETFLTTVRTPLAGEVVLMRSPADDELVVKRVLAVGPATVVVDEVGVIRVNGVPIPRSEGCPGVAWEQALRDGGEELGAYRCFMETYASGPVAVVEDCAAHATSVTLGTGEYFVMGDNRCRSNDSRNPHFGAVPPDAVLGVWNP